MLVDEDPIATFQAPAAMHALCDPAGVGPGRMEPPAGAQVFHVRLATSADGREAASLLLRKMYAWRGYAFDVSDHHDANKITLYAETGGVLVGTMSVCLDRAAGRGAQLPADENFPDKLDELRRLGRRLAEPSQLAIDKGVSKRVFAGGRASGAAAPAPGLHGRADPQVGREHGAARRGTFVLSVFLPDLGRAGHYRTPAGRRQLRRQ
jgi:hypothetical protein